MVRSTQVVIHVLLAFITFSAATCEAAVLDQAFEVEGGQFNFGDPVAQTFRAGLTGQLQNQFTDFFLGLRPAHLLLWFRAFASSVTNPPPVGRVADDRQQMLQRRADRRAQVD